MGGKRLLVVSCAAALVLSGCAGGAGAGADPPLVTAASGPVTFNYTPGFVCCPKPSSISVGATGSATRTIQGSSTVTTVQLSAALTAQIFSDVQKAWPLNKLPPGPQIPDTGGLSVSWDGQTTPNIVDASSGIEAALNTDADQLASAFPPQ